MELGPLAALSGRACAYVRGRSAAAVRWCFGMARAGAFWGTVLLPFVTVGTLATEPPLFVVPLGVNLVCLVLGRQYRPNRSARSTE